MDIDSVKDKLNAVFGIPGFRFDADKHRYTLDGEYLPSATGVIKRWKKPFDRDGIAARMAIKEGREAADIIKEWELKGKKATDLGTEVHTLIENYWAGRKPDSFMSDEAKKRFAAFLDFRKKKLPNLFVVDQEVRIFSRKYKCAGTLDFLGLNRRDGRLYLFDWKTNSKFRTDDERAFDRLLPPFDELDDNELNNYSLQISLYRLILREEAGIDVPGGMILHLPAGGANPQMYQAKDLTKEIGAALSTKLLRQNAVEF